MPEMTTPGLWLAILGVAGYLLGSVPFGVVVAAAMGLGDLRKIGSGNIGATNVLRTGNRKAALATLLLDAAKGAVAVILAHWLGGDDAAQLAAFTALLGHCFPVWLRFRGGKGVATFLGILLAIFWPLGLAACAVWLVVAALTRYSSLSALLAAVCSPILAHVLGRPDLSLLCLALAIIIVLRHSANIARLRAGTEPKIGQK
ncbi:glycerol-3-phosphate 1-O-acyltransferase PlsY [Pseudoroseicyclus sp. CLL3-39]|uniref:Glycerol-3-phosphate acyltransferase n=2 Tax=Pseudoroseicyclus tamaricis TaxID=2705421 RepID=A0A6B2JSD2_9RHOB|nr:glycerol-3-phosphate 1-O-acyltransferase PlsY [Pseudoroseicyclus tamaricis]NDU99488.1 glycerol-3-phosphate 1-O-acyltransferase PlsY [Pseudoroseicyclus tamaricis]